jgi:hypothetical protein
MIWLAVGVVVGAACFAGGLFLGLRLCQPAEEAPKKRSRRPKCYVIGPDELGKDERTE